MPKIDDIIKDERLLVYKEKLPDSLILEIVRETVDTMRKALPEKTDKAFLRENAVQRCVSALSKLYNSRLKRVINATGVLIHTNLGRAPIPPSAAAGLAEMLEGYTNLEYDLDKGKRRSRGYYAERLICGLTGAEASAVVNNNAAALLLVLNTLSNGWETVLSRGEIVEIGGSFRLSGIIAASGAKLREVGSTNRTRFEDYEENVSFDTGVILKAHTSNYKMIGYTKSVPASELVKIGKKLGVPVVEDMGSGVLTDLTLFGLPYERQAADAIREGVDIITFSGDKLLGGPQAGIIAGRKDIIDKIRKNPLMRCVRPDKAALWMLEGCLSAYCKQGAPDIPVLKNAAADTLDKARKLLEIIGTVEGFNFEVVETTAEIGGGTLPGFEIKSHGVAVTSNIFTASEIEKRLRTSEIPVICRINEDKIILDVIAMDENDFNKVKVCPLFKVAGVWGQSPQGFKGAK